MIYREIKTKLSNKMEDIGQSDIQRASEDHITGLEQERVSNYPTATYLRSYNCRNWFHCPYKNGVEKLISYFFLIVLLIKLIHID